MYIFNRFKTRPCLFLIFMVCFSMATNAQKQLPIPTNEWAIKIKQGASIKKVAESLNVEKVRPIGTLSDYYLLTFKDHLRQKSNIENKLKQNSRILWSEQQLKRRMVTKNWNDPLLADQWHLNNTGQGGGTAGADAHVFAAWDLGYSGKGVQICIVDDGLEKDHEDLAPNFILADSWDFNGSNGNDPSPADLAFDHGTACAGVAAAKGNNDLGGSGVAYDGKLSGIRLLADAFTNATTAMALNFKNNDNLIYSNSWGPRDNGEYNTPSPLVKAALEEGAANGRNGLGSLFVWAAGNGRGNADNTNYDGYVNSIYTIGVGAFADDGSFSSYSEPGASMLISAPSSGGASAITTTTTNNDYTNAFGGTSSATPVVSGIIALMLEANPLLTWRDVQHILIESAAMIDPGNSDWTLNGGRKNINHNYGFGGVDAAAAVSLALDWTNVAPASSDTLPLLVVDEVIEDGTGAEIPIYGTPLSKVITVDRDLMLEQVELKINLTHIFNGDIRIRLISPSGTESILAEARYIFTSDLNDHYFMTVRNWGESSVGDWTILFDDGLADGTGTWVDAQLILHGVDDSCTASDLTIDEDPIAAGNYQTNAGITSKGIIPAKKSVTFQAGDQIVLEAGFYAMPGSKFTAKIEGCSLPALRQQTRPEELELASIDPGQDTKASLAVYPNPSAYSTRIAYQLEQDSEVMIQLLDINGRMLEYLQDKAFQTAGSYHIQFKTENLQPGIYFVKLSNEYQQFVERIMVQR